MVPTISLDDIYGNVPIGTYHSVLPVFNKNGRINHSVKFTELLEELPNTFLLLPILKFCKFKNEQCFFSAFVSVFDKVCRERGIKVNQEAINRLYSLRDNLNPKTLRKLAKVSPFPTAKTAYNYPLASGCWEDLLKLDYGIFLAKALLLSADLPERVKNQLLEYRWGEVEHVKP